MHREAHGVNSSAEKAAGILQTDENYFRISLRQVSFFKERQKEQI